MKRVKQILLWVALLAGDLQTSDQPERKVLRHPDPEYPSLAEKINLHGTVKLKIWVAPNRSVRRLEYLGGHPLLAESALKAVRTWKYEPAAKESTLVVEVKF